MQAFEQGKAAKAGAGTLEKTKEEEGAAEADHDSSKDMEASMWPALYMLEAYVRIFYSRAHMHTPEATSS